MNPTAEAKPLAALTTASWWLLHYPDGAPVEVAFWPPVTHDEALAAYPDAIAAAPLPDPPPADVTGPAGEAADSEDDRRRCTECANLNPGGVCAVAAPGGPVVARRG